jgi:hypothetical protein
MNTVYLDPKQVPANLKRNYTGQKFQARIVESVTIPSHAGLWDGGSRDTYTLIDLATGYEAVASDNVSAPWDARADRKIVLRPGFAVVEHSMFQGKDLGLTFYLLAENAAALLPAPVTLTPHQKCVLVATSSLKSSYNGKDRYSLAKENARWEYGAKEYGLDFRAEFLTRAEWETAKAELIAAGYLNKAGAITTKGKNAAQ